MSKNSLVTITPVLLCGSVAAMLALSSPAVARGGGHHHGECGEHHIAYECGHPNYKVWHHRGHDERYFEDHHRSEYPRETFNTCGALSAPHYLPTPRRGRPNLSSY
jgi:hypothetical protein